MLKDFNAVKITVASPQDILNWSHGEVTKAETINYRTFKPEPGGLMAEEIFGPTKDFECYCGKYKKVRYKGIVCDRCGVEVTHKRVRRERMGHIKLAAPMAHVWFSNGVPNRLALILDIPQKKLETVIYYARYVVTNVDLDGQKEAVVNLAKLKEEELKDLETELNEKVTEVAKNFEEQAADLQKSLKDKKKLELQLERLRNTEKAEVAKVRSAFKQRQENIEQKFDDLKSLVEGLSLRSTLSEEEFTLLEEYELYFFEAGMGAEAVKSLLEKLNLKKEIEELNEVLKASKSQLRKSRVIQRLRALKGLLKSGTNPSWLILDILPVIPPDLRPIIQLPGGRFATYDLNDLYRRVINRNNRLKRLILLGAPEIILRNEKRMLQEAVDSLLDNNHKPGAPALNSRKMPYKSLSDMLRGKQGRFRQNLLGKRVDYSGRAVIISGPELQFHQCGLPKTIALELFRPFIIRELISRGLAANPTRAKAIFESKSDEVWDILEEVSKDRPVLLNRAPTLHKQSILAFYPILIEGNAIKLHPMTCKGFNADFDGDQMAVHLPLTDEAVEEVKERMFVKENMLSSRDGTPIVNVAKDMSMGVYFLTLMKGNADDVKRYFSSEDDALSAYTLKDIKFHEPIKLLKDGGVIVTTVGRIIFNQILPENFGFINEAINEVEVSEISSKIFRDYGKEVAIGVLDRIKDLGFQYSTKLGFSISMGEFRFGADDVVKEGLKDYEAKVERLLEDYYDGMITKNELLWLKQKEWEKVSDEIQDQIWQMAKNSDSTVNLMDLDSSGATKVSAWVKKISGVRGYVSDMFGQIINYPLAGNYEKGLNNFEYFVAAKAVRKSMTDVALKTSESGYLTRRLVDVAQDIITKIEDCGTTEGIEVHREEKTRQQEFWERLKGRFLVEDVLDPASKRLIAKAGDEITLELAKEIHQTEGVATVKVRSALTCKVSHGICAKCYGYDNATGKLVDIGQAVGIIAAQALGEPTTQLTLKSKSDARAGKADVTQGFPRVEELFEARTPKALAILAEEDGIVKILEDKKKILVRVIAKVRKEKAFSVEEGDTVLVKNNAKVKSNDTVIIKKDKTEIKAEESGIIRISDNGQITLQIERDMEIDKYTDLISDLIVEDGQEVKRGDQLTVGSVDTKELARLKSIEDAQNYIVAGVQMVYGLNGLKVDDRHLEIIVRQMGRYGLINASGTSENFLPGDYADILDIEEENKSLESKVEYERVLMGITNSSIRTESFLSAASFEQQVRVLTDAALIGKVDYLRGLKENVIIGKPVPLGKVLKEKLTKAKEENLDQ